MAHVCVINVTPYEPAHRAAREDIRSEVFLRCDSRRAHYSGQAVCSDAHNFLVLVLVIKQGGNRPYLHRVTGRK